MFEITNEIKVTYILLLNGEMWIKQMNQTSNRHANKCTALVKNAEVNFFWVLRGTY